MKTPAWLRNWRVRRRIHQYQIRGRQPWTRGYEEYKEQEIRRILTAGIFNPEMLPRGYGYRLDERIVEIPWLFSRLSPGKTRFLDAGSALNYSQYLKHPSLSQKDIHILTLAPENRCFWKSGVSYIFADLRHLPYRCEWFDEIACISTLEHVGMDNTFLYASSPGFKENSPEAVKTALVELHRVLKPGGKLWLTVPVGKPANLGWLQIFSSERPCELARAVFQAPFGSWYFAYSAEGWSRAEPGKVAGAGYFDWHRKEAYGGNFSAAAEAICCLEMVKSK